MSLQSSLRYSALGVPTRNGYPSFSTAEIGRHHAAVRELLRREGLELALAYGAGRFDAEMLYLSAWPCSRESYVLLPLQGEPRLLVQLFNHVPLAKQLSLIPETRWAGSTSPAGLAESIGELGLERARIGLIGSLPFHQRDRLAELLPQAEFVDLNGPYRELRTIRSEEEIAFIKAGAELCDRGMEALERELRPGLREYELQAIVERPFLEAGGHNAIHFMCTTPMADSQIYVPHQFQSDRVIERGDVLITEVSGAFWGSSGQIHRTYTLGAPTAEWQRIHDVAMEAYDAIESVLRDGATIDDVLDAADVIHARGYTILDDLLHGFNQYPPIMQTRQTDRHTPKSFTFRENMVITIQPQLTTLDQKIGLQYGETVRITKTGTERLHRYKRELVVV